MSNIYEEYALLDAQEAVIKAKKEQLRPAIIKMMVEKGEKKVETGVGSFSVGKRKVWAYPESVTAINDQFKAAKAKAESTGEATCEEVEQLRFTKASL